MRYIWTRMRRKPLTSAAVLLFAAVIAAALCGLHSGTLAAQAHYSEIYQQIEIRCTVTNLAGDQSDNLSIIPWELSQFTGDWQGNPTPLMELLEDIQIKGSVNFTWNGKTYTLTGVTSLRADPRLLPENGCTIFWNEGADESMFYSSKLQCIIPQEMMKTMQEMEAYRLAEEAAEAGKEDAPVPPEDIEITTLPLELGSQFSQNPDWDSTLEIMGTYQGSSETTVYCAWDTYAAVAECFGLGVMADAVSATLRNNQDLALLREAALEYFAEPDIQAAGLNAVGGYLHALDINDSQLQQAKQDLENSITVNQIAAALVFVLSAGAGAFVGFLMIRSRKREIALMRTMGASGIRIYASCAVEQMVCAILGAVLGGAYFSWQPPLQLCLFAGVYFAGLSIALWIFLRKNLLASIKEDE